MTNKTFYLNSSFEAKSFSKGSKSLKIAGYANSITKDRAGDVVTAEAWAKGVENYRKNPFIFAQSFSFFFISSFRGVQNGGVKRSIYYPGKIKGDVHCTPPTFSLQGSTPP